MKRLSITFAVLTLLVCAPSARGINTGPVKGDSIGILSTPEEYARGVDRSIRDLIPKYLRDELQRDGFRVSIVGKSLEEMDTIERAIGHDFYLEVVYSDAEGGPVVNVGTGGASDSIGLGADVAVIAASVHAELRLYDGSTLEQVDSFVLDSHNVSPTISGVGVAGRHGYIYLPIPFFWNAPYRRAARQIARDAVDRITNPKAEQVRH